MNKTIKFTLSNESITKAIDELKAYRKDFDRRFRTAIKFLAEQSAQHLKDAGFYEHMMVSYDVEFGDRLDALITITAIGDMVGFIEFGTGAYADEQHPFREEAPFPVFSGSFSDTVGAGTWSAWISAGKPEEDYPYNLPPQRPLYNTAVWMRDNAERLVKWSMDNDYR